MTQTPTTPPSDRRLVVGEFNAQNPEAGKLFALTPGQATGIPIPTFRMAAGLPAAGTIIGEAVYDKVTRRGAVWDGTAWRDVTASPILRYVNDALVQADLTQPIGSFAVSGATGNLFVFTTSGWQRMGTQEYPTVAALLSETPAIGTIGLALDEDSVWEFGQNGWRCTSVRLVPNTAAVQAWAGTGTGIHVGDQALAADVDVVYVRAAQGWRPASVFDAPEAVIRAATWPLDGQEAVATDTGRRFVWAGGAWIEQPIQHYATEALLQAAAPPDGTLAWGDDNGLVYARSNGTWRRVNGPTNTVADTAPAHAVNGDVWFNTADGGIYAHDGSNWIRFF